MTRSVCASAALIAFAFGSSPARHLSAHAERGQRLDEVTTLAGNIAAERQLGRRQQDRYTIALKAGDYARIIVEQQGVDAIVELRDPDDRLIAEFQDEVRPRGEEQVDVAAAADGTYALVVEAAPGTVVPGVYTIRITDVRTATADDRAMQDGRRLRTTAAQLEKEGRFDDARVALERALTITERVRGCHELQVAAVVAQLAGVYRKLPDDARSESSYQRAIEILDRTLGPDHPSAARVRSLLALLYQHEGERRKAELLLRQALDVIERTLGSDHPWFVDCLTTLGNLRDDAGDLEEEQAIIERALATVERTGETNSIRYAALLNNLGEVYRQKQDYDVAEDLLSRSFELGERLLGPDNYSIATALQNLGIVARERKDYGSAVAYNVRALSIRERTVGSNHPDVAHILTNLANIYRSIGDYTRSLETHLRALRIWENAAGPYQQATLLSVGNIAKTYAASGDVAHAVEYQRRADAIIEKELALNLAIGSERQKLAFVASVSERTDRTVSLHLEGAPANPDAGALAAQVLLQRKGRVLDAMSETFAAVRQRVADPNDRERLDQLNATTAQLARLALRAESTPPEQRDEAIKRLEAKKERLEADLSEDSAELRAQMQPVTLEAVQASIPDDAALLEFAIYRPFNPKAERNAEAYDAPRYAAYIVRRHAPPHGVDLGAVGSIDEVVAAFREALRDPRRGGLQERARHLDELILQPLRAHFGGAARLLISPDGELNLVPFEALVDEQNRYLIERYAISYLTSGRDLLRMRVARTNRSRPVIIADPLFGEPGTTRTDTRRRDVAATRVTQRDSVTTGDDRSTMYFAPLGATAAEARAIKTLFPDATLLTGPRATKAALQRVEAPIILHIASHGFFLRETPGTAHVDNPLLRSGLALAGANVARDERDDGIFTALEASSLNLWGTRLVTLSGCDTGVGEVRNGEGVYGLRRAFVLAGTETVVMSLWPVSDAIARETMVAYYTRLRAGLGRGDALRQAKLEMLRRDGRQHPFYWATFIQSGEWASLNGKR